MMNSPKSAENVFNPKTDTDQQSAGQLLRRKKSTEEVAELLESEMLGKLAEIDHWLVNPEDNSDSTNSMGKRSISPMCPSSSREIFDGRFQTIGSQSTLNQVAENSLPPSDRNLTRSNRSSSLRSGRASIRTRSETPVTAGTAGQRQSTFRPELMSELFRITPPSFNQSTSTQRTALEDELNDFLNRSPLNRRQYNVTTNQHAIRNLPRRLTHRTLSSDRQASAVSRNQPRQLFELFPVKFNNQKYQYYDIHLFNRPWLPFRLYYSRQELLDLIDESNSALDIVLCAVCTGMVACLTSYLSMITRPIAIFGYKSESLLFEGMSLPALFVVGATCQYAMIKSPVPDTASPSHGYSRSMAYARAVYFLLIGSMLLLTVHFSTTVAQTGYQLELYHVTLVTEHSLAVAIEVTKYIILLMPIFFTLGLFSQIKTFLNWIMEEVEYHMLGGSGSSGLHSVVISIVRSVVCFMVPLLFAFLATSGNQNSHSYLSAFCALSVAICYMLSRQSNSNPDHDLIAVKATLGVKNVYDAVEEISKPDKNTVRSRLETTMIICLCQFVFFFLIAISNIFDEMNEVISPIRLTPTHNIKFFSIILCGILCLNGIYLHYLIPTVRNPNPWGLFKAPLLKNNEWKKFEVTEPAKVMWFETMNLYLNLIERNVLLPLAVLNEAWIAFNADYFDSWSNFGKAFFITICVCKLLRHSFRSNHYQWFVLLCAHFLAYDLRRLKYEEPVLVTWFIGNFVYVKVIGTVLKRYDHLFII